MATPDTVVHLVRHGEVHNPEGVLYGRKPGFHLSDLGHRMAEKASAALVARDVVKVVSSPLERTRETAQPFATSHGLDVVTDERVIESESRFQGDVFGAGARTLLNPRKLRHLWNPFRPSWGEPYVDIVERMMDLVCEVRAEVAGHEAVVVSHQLPIWTTRMHLERRRTFVHDPRKRQCTLCSVTSLHFVGGRVTQVAYSEPAGDLIPVGDKSAPFSAGGASEERRPS
jgi:broad specificity phosphatase PhoE